MTTESLSSSELLTTARPKHPYPGLRPFDHDEWSIFFGREQMIDDVIERLGAHHLVLIHGSSGSGKSSLVRAGVLPKLARQHLRAGAAWLTCSIRPSGGPLWNLAKEFARLEGRGDEVKRVGEIMREFNRRGATLPSIAGTLKNVQGRRLCILVDQFEELFRYERTSREEAELFVDLLVGAGRAADSAAADEPATTVHIVVTMRSEFLGECTRFKGLAEVINRTQYLVPAMDHDALLRAIRRPALLYGGEVSLSLAERMIADVEGREDALPLIQHGLMYLWNTATAKVERGEKRVLDVGPLESAGGLVNLLSSHADSVVSRAAPDRERQRAVEDLFRALTDLNVEGRAIRRPQAFRDLVAVTGTKEETLRAIIDALRADGVSFLTPFGEELISEATPIDISHEALIRCWRRLADPQEGWLKQEFDDGLIWRSLVVEARAFDANPQHVLTPATTDERAKWWQNRQPNAHWAARYEDNFELVKKLLDTSRSEAERFRREAQQRQRAEYWERLKLRLQFAGIGALVVLLGVAGFAVWQRLVAIELREQIATLDRDFAVWEAKTAREERERAMKDREEAMAQRRRAVTNLAQYVARLSNETTDRGDAGGGMLLALEPGPYVPETEDALNYGYQRLQELAMLRGHASGVTGIAFHPDGKRVATASLDRTARLWDVATGREIHVLRGHESNVRSVAFSPDGKLVLTASDDRTARLWDAETGKEIRVLSGHFGAVRSARFSPDGARVVTVSNDKTARVWDTASGQVVHTLTGHREDIWGAAFSPDGKIATASDDKTARLWDGQTGKEIFVLSGHESYLNGIAISRDGNIATAGVDSIPRLWDAKGQLIRGFRGHEGSVLSVAFHGDRLLLTTSEDKSARLWDVETGAQMMVLRGHEGEVQSAAVSPDGKLVATASLDGTARLWDIQGPRGITVLRGFGGKVWSAAFSPDGKRVVTASADRTARLWDVENGREILVLRGHEGAVFGTAFAPDGKRVATAAGDNTARIWDAETGQQLVVLRGHDSLVISVQFDADGKHVVTASYDQTARLWDATTGAQIRAFRGHEKPVIHAAFSPDGKRIVTASDDRTVRLWSTESGNETLALRGHKDRVWYAAFSPDGQTVVTGALDKTARLWDAASGEEIRVFEGHQGSVYSAAFSPDGSRLVTASLDKTARIWDVQTGKVIGSLRGHTDAVAHAIFSRDGQRVATSSQDATARLWRVFTSMEELSDTAKSATPRCLTRAQRKAAFLEPAPPAWCVEQGKWPYHTQAWKDWLQYSQTNPDLPLPDQPEWFDAAIRMAPNNPNAYFNRGNRFFDNQEYDRAIADFAAALRLDPGNAKRYSTRSAEAFYRRAEVFFEKLDYDRAIADYDQAIGADPDNRNYRTRNAEAYFRRGNASFGKQDYERALADYRQALELEPNNPAYRPRHDNVRAIVDASEAIRTNPNNAEAYGKRGEAYLAEKDHDRAIVDLEIALKLDPKTASYKVRAAGAYYDRGYASYDRRDYESAVADYSEAIRLDPTPQRFNSRCWSRAIIGDLQAALADCNEALRLRPEYANALDSRAFTYLKLGELDNAIADYDAALKLEPRSEYSLYGRGIARQKKGDEQGGAADIEAAKKIRAAIVDDFARFGIK